MLALAPALALAQPPDDRERLPSLTPRVFESTGTIAVSLPDIERQPLSGFGPPPRTFVVPADRESVALPFAPDLDALPALALAPPPEPARDDRVLRRFRAEGGYGRDAARFGRLDVSASGAAGEFFVDAAYDGIDGPLGTVARDAVDLRGGGQTFGAGRFRLVGHALRETYETPDQLAADRRVRQSLGAELSAEGVGRVPFGVAVGFDENRLDRIDGSEPETTESRVFGRAHLDAGRLRADAAAGAASPGTGFGALSARGTNVVHAAGGLAVSLGRSGGLTATVGVRTLYLDADAAAAVGDRQEIAPVLDARLPIGAAATAFALNDPRLDVRSLSDLAATNPFVSPRPLVAPDVIPVDARIGLELRPGRTRARAFVRVLSAPTFLYFEPNGGTFLERYGDVSMVGVGAEIALAMDAVTASASVEARRTDLDGADALPFVAPLVGRAGVQAPLGRGRVGLAAYAEGTRPADRNDATQAEAWGRLSLDVRHPLVGPFAAVARAERLVGSAEQWPGSPHPSFTALLGLRLGR